MTVPRTKFLDYDARRTPKTDFCCVLCQRDLDPGDRKVRWVRLIDDVLVLHPADEALYTPDAYDRGTFPIGADCAKKIGLEWTRPAADLTSRPGARRDARRGKLRQEESHAMTTPFTTFFALRSLSPSASEIHLVGGTDLGADRGDAIMAELTEFVRSCLEVLGEGQIAITQLGERGMRVNVDAAMLAVIERQAVSRLHDKLAGLIRHRYPIDLDVVSAPQNPRTLGVSSKPQATSSNRSR